MLPSLKAFVRSGIFTLFIASYHTDLYANSVIDYFYGALIL
jgi:hypothetical protein